MRRLYKYGLVFVSQNRLLLCRPHAFPDLITPGGIKDGNEDHITNLCREVREELGPEANLVITSLKYLGNFEESAAGRVETTVEIELYQGEIEGNVVPSSEIAELVWYDACVNNERLSPIVADRILPFLKARGILRDCDAAAP